jgi:[acyl-carrier-protein] S-malonyltransferase
MTLAVLCSGQGAQHRQMFAMTAGEPAAQHLFRFVSGMLDGEDPRTLVQAPDASRLQSNRLAQLLCTLAPAAVSAALGDTLPAARLVAGYSVGEMTAWHVAGAIDALELLQLTGLRAAAMDAASSGDEGLLAVRGLSQQSVSQLCTQSGAALAIINPEDLYIVGGSQAQLTQMKAQSLEAGASRVTPVGVRVAAHTPRLATASEEFGKALQPLESRMLRSGVRLLSGIDGAAVFDTGDGLRKLAAQLSRTVNWSACLQACLEAGATAFLELGPGRALSAMARQIAPDIEARAVDDFHTLDGLRGWLRRVAGEGV